MTSRTRSSIHVAATIFALAIATTAGAQVPGPDRIEVVQTSEGPRVLLAGVGVGTAYARAVERLGGPGLVGAFFGGGPIMLRGDVDGASCSLLVQIDGLQRVQDLYLECDGGRAALQRLATRIRAALATLPRIEDARTTSYGTDDTGLVASVAILPADDHGWWARTFGPRQLRMGIRR